jgi:hypothetical protein
MLESWATHRRETKPASPEEAAAEKALISAAFDEPLKHRPLQLEMKVQGVGEAPHPESSVRMAVQLVYRSGKRIDLELEDGVAFEFQPDLGRLRGDRIDFSCVATEVVIYSKFLNALSSAQVFNPRKKLDSLSLGIHDAWKSAGNSPGQLQLKLEARCQDGTQSDVTCLAQWSMLSSESAGAKLGPCGRLEGTHSGDRLRVRARYGPLSSESTITAP